MDRTHPLRRTGCWGARWGWPAAWEHMASLTVMARAGRVQDGSAGAQAAATAERRRPPRAAGTTLGRAVAGESALHPRRPSMAPVCSLLASSRTSWRRWSAMADNWARQRPRGQSGMADAQSKWRHCNYRVAVSFAIDFAVSFAVSFAVDFGVDFAADFAIDLQPILQSVLQSQL